MRALGHRTSGILLHPTSLPGPGTQGDLGADAKRFVDFMASCGFGVWQVLPLNPPHEDGSPYQAQSAHAGNPRLISLDWIAERGWLDADDISMAASAEARARLLKIARTTFTARADADLKHEFDVFLTKHSAWLPDYALFRALRRHHGGNPWWEWPSKLRDRDPKALSAAKNKLHEHIAQCIFEQFVFFKQWLELRSYANARGIRLFGDMPIFVAHDSADVWCERELFDLDERGLPRHVAGVPPDYFSATGQRWGNPLYEWSRMEADDFGWWKRRLATQLELFDFLRVDHFRGFEACWAIPGHESTAQNGYWQPTPGRSLLDALVKTFGDLPLIAEDLGIITPEVEHLRDDYGLPGMKILQFAFDGDSGNPYLPHNHIPTSVVYTGTHDNDTSLGWIASQPAEIQRRIQDYLGAPEDEMPWPILRTAFASVARLAIIPMQDFLGLGTAARMNTPGTVTGNWQWRFTWEQVDEDMCERIRAYCRLYGRKIQ